MKRILSTVGLLPATWLLTGEAMAQGGWDLSGTWKNRFREKQGCQP
jgi:hypothetical protein